MNDKLKTFFFFLGSEQVENLGRLNQAVDLEQIPVFSPKLKQSSKSN